MEALYLAAPLWSLVLIGFGFGCIIGSFLNVAIYRFHTGKSLSGRSHCMSCARYLTWCELFPLVSYLALRARCSSCKSIISPRYFIVELLTGILFAATFALSVHALEVLIYWYIFSILVMITVYDINHYIIPDKLTLLLTAGVAALYGFMFLERYRIEWLTYDIIAALGGSLFFFVLWFVSSGRWLGFGDVKLAFPLGLLVGASGVFSFVVVSFWVGAALSILLLGFQALQRRGKPALQLPSGNLTMKSAVPFAPFLIIGSVLVLFYNINVLTLFSFYI